MIGAEAGWSVLVWLEIVAAPASRSRTAGTEAAAIEAATTRERITNTDDFRVMTISLEVLFAFPVESPLPRLRPLPSGTRGHTTIERRNQV
jgi:hypothetical protein